MFGAEVDAAVKAHALAEYPREACGLVIDGSFVPFANVLRDPHDVLTDPYSHFQLPAGAWPTDGRKVQAVVHSHCAPWHMRQPSGSDAAGQIETDVPWGIVLCDGKECTDILWWGDFRLDDPLIGAQYMWIVSDCWSVIRRWHWQKRGVKRPDFPRDYEAFRGGESLFLQWCEAAGLEPIQEHEIADGDVVFMAIRSSVPNHCAVICDGGLMLHHLPDRLSCREPFGRWRRLKTHQFRFKP